MRVSEVHLELVASGQRADSVGVEGEGGGLIGPKGEFINAIGGGCRTDLCWAISGDSEVKIPRVVIGVGQVCVDCVERLSTSGITLDKARLCIGDGGLIG